MNMNIKKRTYYICLNESINLSQFWNMSEKGDDSSPFSKPMGVRYKDVFKNDVQKPYPWQWCLPYEAV
jgi:hypothetical protein